MWRPDFIVEITGGGLSEPLYLILDAKYSTEGVVQDVHLPAITKKHYWGMSFFSAMKGASSNRNICGVCAVFPKGSGRLINGRTRARDISSIKNVFPMIFAARLSIDAPREFDQVVSQVVDQMLAVDI